MANVVTIDGTSCYLKDRSGNILVPKTNSALVTFPDGDTLDEKIANIVDSNSLSELTTQIEDLRTQVNRLNFDIGTTNNYYRLRELNNDASKTRDDLISIKNDIANFNELLNRMTNLEGKVSALENQMTNLQQTVTNHNQTNESLVAELNEKVAELEKRIDDFPNGEIVNIEKIEVKDESGVLINSLLASTDMYEYMCATIDGFTNRPVKESIVNAYVDLYKLEVKRISDMPTHIQDLVTIRLM